MKIFFTAFLLCTTFLGFTQKATISGVVTDLSSGETLPFGSVFVEGNTAIGSSTNFEGAYSLKLDEGKYNLVFLFTSYEKHIEEIIVRAGESIEKNISVKSSLGELEEVTVTTEKTTAKTDAAFDREKMNSSSMIDGASAEQMKKTGDSDAGEVIKRVTGVSVVGGKEVFVRGLGDRYTKTTLNGMEIPGLDPDRNTVQMDIFPTNLIDNITVYKTFLPNLPGDFTGGLVDIKTKDFPTKETFSFSAGFGYNTETTFNKNYLGYKGGSLDFIGMDDGTRALPINTYSEFKDPALNDKSLTTLTKSFDKTMAPEESLAFLNQSYSVGYGNQKKSDSINLSYGYNVAFSYQNSHKLNSSAEINAYRKEPEASEISLFRDRKAEGNIASRDVIWSALIGQSIKYNKKNKISLNLFHTQNGNASSAILLQNNSELNPATLEKTSLQYNQRSVTNVNLSGKHNSSEKWTYKWGVSPSLSRISSPDIRSTILEIDENDSTNYLFSPSVGSEIRRIYRDLLEVSLNSKLDVEYSYKGLKNQESKLMFGLSQLSKSRDFIVSDYTFNVENVDKIESDPNWFFLDENIWTPQNDKGTYVRDGRQESNTYFATQNIIAAYTMTELPVSEKLKTVFGVRVEQAQNYYTGKNNSGSVVYTNELVLDELSILPAFNFVYKLRDSLYNNMNLRGSYAKTVARPSFREKSISQVYDPIAGRRFNGNLDLIQTDIHNVDVRWEHFYGRTEVLSASAFYKRFNNPIEIVAFDLAPDEVQPINTGVADVYGIELEFRKRLGFINEDHKKLFIGANYTYVNSQIDMNKVLIEKGDSFVTEKKLRETNARDGEVVSDSRPLFGQSPYIVNAFVSFGQDSLGLELNLSYNVQGKRLAVIGVGSIPDVYEQPFHSLNFKASKTVGGENKWKASVRIQNILNNKRQRFYESFNSENQVYDLYKDGVTFSASISYKF